MSPVNSNVATIVTGNSSPNSTWTAGLSKRSAGTWLRTQRIAGTTPDNYPNPRRPPMRKQGRADSNSASGQKREPIPHAISPAGAAQLGTHVIKNPTPLGAGRGFSAPAPSGETNHPSGSQGKHK